MWRKRPDFQLSKTVFILARFCPDKLFKSADKECLILVPLSDLFRRRDFYGFGRFEISHFLPFLRLDARRRFQFLCVKMGHFFFFNSLFFRWSKHKYYLLRVWWMFKFNGLQHKSFFVSFFDWFLVVAATALGEPELYRPANVIE